MSPCGEFKNVLGTAAMRLCANSRSKGDLCSCDCHGYRKGDGYVSDFRHVVGDQPAAEQLAEQLSDHRQNLIRIADRLAAAEQLISDQAKLDRAAQLDQADAQLGDDQADQAR